MHVNSTLLLFSSASYLFLFCYMSSTEENINNLIKPVADLTECHNSQQQLNEKLEQDVTTVQEDVTEQAIKQATQEHYQKNRHQQ